MIGGISMEIIQCDRKLGLRDIKPGYLCITGDDRVLLYLGVGNDGSYLFYPVCKLMLKDVSHKPGVPVGYYVAYADEARLMPLYKMAAEALPKSLADPELLIRYRSFPGVYGLFMKVEYTIGQLVEWVNKMWPGGDYSEVVTALTAQGHSHIQQKYKPVKSSELEVGKLYVTNKSTIGEHDEGFRCTWMYLGRTGHQSSAEYVYLFFGTPFDEIKTKAQVDEDVQRSMNARLWAITKNPKTLYRPVKYTKIRDYKCSFTQNMANVLNIVPR